ncbi:MAG: radical SAM protein [Candidatus Woesearchaeota archaeon]
MKIMFINPLLGGDFSTLDISITNLATYINERTNHDASITDMTFHTRHWKSHLHRMIQRHRPDVIGMSCNTMYMQYIKKIAEEAKEISDAKIICGGYHASIKPAETLDIPWVDAVCIGDGEFALTEYMDRLSGNKSLAGIKGIWAKKKGGIIKNPGGCFIKNIDEMPTPNWDLWPDLDKYFYYLGMMYCIGTRGCPYKCTYCDAHGISKSVKGNYYRLRNPQAYAKEIAYQWNKYEGRGMRFVQMFDQVPTMNRKWLQEFTDSYKKETDSEEHRYSMFSRIDHLDEEKIRMLAKSGCALLRIGVEAGDPFIRNKIYNKNISNDQIRRIFKLCKRHGVGVTAYYMLGGPGENVSTMQSTIRLAKELDANRSAFFIYKPFTEEGQMLISEYGGAIDQKRWQKADNITFDAVVRLKDVSPATVEWLQRKAYIETFNKRLGKMLRKDKGMYFARLVKYVSSGIYDRLDFDYLVPYFHIYGYDWVDK